MIHYVCDGCGAELEKGELRYTVTIDVRAAYDQLEVGLLDLVRGHKAALEGVVNSLEEADVEALESQIFKQMKLDLCPKCQRKYLKKPIHLDGGGEEETPAVDIDTFLRTLGYGEGEKE